MRWAGVLERLWAQVFQRTFDDNDYEAMITEDQNNHLSNNPVANLEDDFTVHRVNPSVIDPFVNQVINHLGKDPTIIHGINPAESDPFMKDLIMTGYANQL